MLCSMMVSMLEKCFHSLRVWRGSRGAASHSCPESSQRATVRFLAVHRLRRDGTVVADGPCDAVIVVPVGGRISER